jgi:hypothetical protein
VSCSLGRLLCLFDQPEKMHLANTLAYFFQKSVMEKKSLTKLSTDQALPEDDGWISYLVSIL